MRDLLIATRNLGKTEEIRQSLEGLPFRVLSMAELGRELPEVEEDGATLLENAQLKARAYAKSSGLLALADDSGLEVDALDGAPGVVSARWAGPGATDAENNQKLLAELAALGDPPRTAVFRTVMVLAEPDGREDWVAGRCVGLIPRQALGGGGFGYDPLFFVPASGKTFAQMALEEKNRLSHRGEALRRVRQLLIRW
ncbi:MAG TPA: RdgB/HAM1 family non-canonical purine NTP pyrophosphatase [bacterium]|jgi:XTP/dITP diphosphohydrolase|nr:RdgB/HAM1 family non-canonical purine NTP pyrophosphatase [bacterium]